VIYVRLIDHLAHRLIQRCRGACRQFGGRRHIHDANHTGRRELQAGRAIGGVLDQSGSEALAQRGRDRWPTCLPPAQRNPLSVGMPGDGNGATRLRERDAARHDKAIGDL
jgi:hypothetical protein